MPKIRPHIVNVIKLGPTEIWTRSGVIFYAIHPEYVLH
jgi:hypothetical protein